MVPNIKSRNNVVTVDASFPERANGVLFKLGNTGAGLVLFVKDGYLTYEYNSFSFDRTVIRAPQRLPAGHAIVTIELTMKSRDRAAPANISMKVNGQEVANGVVPLTAPNFFTHTGTFDFGIDTGAPVSLQYSDQSPFAFNGKIDGVDVLYK